MKTVLSVAVALFLFSFPFTIPCQSQDNKGTDTLITLSGTKVPGKIRYGIYQTSPREIYFTALGSTRQVTYRPGEIRGYYSSVTREYFTSRTVVIDLSPNTINKLLFSGNRDTTATMTVFLQVIVKGMASLYFYVDYNNRHHYFFQVGKEPVRELDVYYRLDNQGGSQRFLVQNTYKTQLINAIGGGCKGIDNRIRNSYYSGKSLAAVFDYYNQCLGQSSVYVEKKPFEKLFIHPGLILGYASNSIVPTSYDYTLVTPHQQFIVGISLDFPLKKLKNLISLYGDIHFKRYLTTILQQGSYTYINMNYIDLTSMVRLNLPVAPKLQIFAEGGPSTGLFNVDFAADQLDGPQVPYSIQVQFVTGFGLKYKAHYSLEFRYAFGHQASTNVQYHFITHSSYLLFGFSI
ncbi:MAG TPA: hypothetical protein VNE41_06210 [Chitinophagaceae bacterium]|nr:hypothetical protein [Chitinophagaceae bacterium]